MGSGRFGGPCDQAQRCLRRLDSRVGTSPSAAAATISLIEGNPIYAEIMQRRPEALADIKSAVARHLTGQLGDRPVRCELRALVFTAQKEEVCKSTWG